MQGRNFPFVKVMRLKLSWTVLFQRYIMYFNIQIWGKETMLFPVWYAIQLFLTLGAVLLAAVDLVMLQNNQISFDYILWFSCLLLDTCLYFSPYFQVILCVVSCDDRGWWPVCSFSCIFTSKIWITRILLSISVISKRDVVMMYSCHPSRDHFAHHSGIFLVFSKTLSFWIQPNLDYFAATIIPWRTLPAINLTRTPPGIVGFGYRSYTIYFTWRHYEFPFWFLRLPGR